MHCPLEECIYFADSCIYFVWRPKFPEGLVTHVTMSQQLAEEVVGDNDILNNAAVCISFQAA